MTNNQQGESYNRIKVVLVEQGKTSRWLAEQIGKQENTVSRWCLNKVQPSLPQLTEIAKVLDRRFVGAPETRKTTCIYAGKWLCIFLS